MCRDLIVRILVVHSRLNQSINLGYQSPSTSVQSGQYFAWTVCLTGNCSTAGNQLNIMFTDGINHILLTDYPDLSVEFANDLINIVLIGINNGVVQWTENGNARSYFTQNYTPPSYIPSSDFTAGADVPTSDMYIHNIGTSTDDDINLSDQPQYTGGVHYYKQNGNNLFWLQEGALDEIASFYNHDLNTVFWDYTSFVSYNSDFHSFDGNTFVYAP